MLFLPLLLPNHIVLLLAAVANSGRNHNRLSSLISDWNVANKDESIAPNDLTLKSMEHGSGPNVITTRQQELCGLCS